MKYLFSTCSSSRSAGSARTSSEKTAGGRAGSEKAKAPVGGATASVRRPVRQREEPGRGVSKRSSTVSSVGEPELARPACF